MTLLAILLGMWPGGIMLMGTVWMVMVTPLALIGIWEEKDD